MVKEDKKEAKKLQVFGKFGGVKTVNGAGPDENGNIEINALPDDTEQLSMLIDADMLPVVHDTNGAILTDEKGNIVLRY